VTPTELQRFVKAGESATIEFKRCGGQPESDVFETVCSFANRYGGHIFLGINDDAVVEGINPSRVPEIKRNLVNVTNNSKLFDPSPVIETEDIEYEGKLVILVWVPMSPYVVRFKNIVYDRVADVDKKIRSEAQMSAMYLRKQTYYTEQHIYKHLEISDFDEDLINRVRRMALIVRPDHPWKTMNNEMLLRSAKLYGENYETGEAGYTLAAALLFGKDDVISSICPSYYTDAIVRKTNTDRFDDRLIIKTNLIDAYESLSTFTRNALPDHFHLEVDRSVSPRDIIVRELISNSLIHREYSSPIPARIIIDNLGVRTENASRSLFEGRIQLSDFSPIPKNPLLVNLFQQIGLADSLGSGIHNMHKYSLAYTGKEPEFSDGDIFRAFIPSTVLQEDLQNTNDAQVAQATHNLDIDEIIMKTLNNDGYITASGIALSTGKTARTVRRHIARMVQQGVLKPQGESQSRRYTSAQ
jgi:ATP-dependent DNA helicase RecG